eukprot:1686249-Amphidinium_carterae.1
MERKSPKANKDTHPSSEHVKDRHMTWLSCSLWTHLFFCVCRVSVGMANLKQEKDTLECDMTKLSLKWTAQLG